MVLIDPLYSAKQLFSTIELAQSARRWLEPAPFRACRSQSMDSIPGILCTLYRTLATASLPADCSGFQARLSYNLQILKNLARAYGRASRVQAPCLVIWGEQDRMLDPTSFPSLISRLPYAARSLCPDVVTSHTSPSRP